MKFQRIKPFATLFQIWRNGNKSLNLPCKQEERGAAHFLLFYVPATISKNVKILSKLVKIISEIVRIIL